jgi:hypothetical protein
VVVVVGDSGGGVVVVVNVVTVLLLSGVVGVAMVAGVVAGLESASALASGIHLADSPSAAFAVVLVIDDIGAIIGVSVGRARRRWVMVAAEVRRIAVGHDEDHTSMMIIRLRPPRRALR